MEDEDDEEEYFEDEEEDEGDLSDMHDFQVAIRMAPKGNIYERYDSSNGDVFVTGIEAEEKRLPNYGRYGYNDKRECIVIVNNAGCSCGVYSINGLSVVNRDPKSFFKVLLETYKFPNGLTIVFSDNRFHNNGEKLAEYILKYELGDLVALPPTRNPNSGNMIITWLWVFNKKKVEEFMKRTDIEVTKEKESVQVGSN